MTNSDLIYIFANRVIPYKYQQDIFQPIDVMWGIIIYPELFI